MTPNLFKALVAAQKKAKAVEKEARNSYHNYNYASAEAIIGEARDALSSEGLALIAVKHQSMGSLGVGRVQTDYLLIHGESGEALEIVSTVPVIPEKGRPEDKAEFGARTEGLAYILRDLLLLPRVGKEDITPSARDDRQPQQQQHRETRAPKAPAKSAKDATNGLSVVLSSNPTGNPAVDTISGTTAKRVQVAIAALKLGSDLADKQGLKPGSTERNNFIRDKNLAYISHGIGRPVSSVLSLKEEEGVQIALMAEAGEIPEQQ